MGKFNRDRGGRDRDRRGGGFDRRGGGHSFGRGGGFGKPSMHKVVCDACGKDCEVPFKPRNDKPIYCNDCFAKQGGNDRPKFGGGRDRDSRSGSGSSDDTSKEILKGIKTLNYKLDELIKTLNQNTATEKATEEAKPATIKKATAKKTATKKVTTKKAATTKKKVATKKKK